ncbi:MAG: UDP-N-acetylmuramoyl-tripeptide--D-alanyl-D-alanine ligase [Nitrospirota bacterium]
MKLNIEDVIEATGGQIICINADSFTGISIDSRTIKEGELFLALRGSRFDAHDFLDEALTKGSGAIVCRHLEDARTDKTIIYVEDTLDALQSIARFLRRKRKIPVIAITGSNGKTTTKELVVSILGTKYRVLKNKGNLNNHIGLPLSLTDLDEKDEIIVLEMGASAPGEIRDLCEIALPNYGILTNVGEAHLAGLRDLKTVRETKLELLDYVQAVAVNADDSFLMAGIEKSGFKGRLIRYAIQNDAEVRATDIKLLDKGLNFMLHAADREPIETHSEMSGIFNIYNILAAVSMSILFDVGTQKIREAISAFKGVPMRLEIKEKDGVRFIKDFYNANPTSMENAIRELARVKKGRRIAVLGDMLELGSYAEEAHRQIGRLISRLSIDVVVAVGPLMAFAASEIQGNVYTAETPDIAKRIVKNICLKGDTVLIKGSRGMRMERVVEDYAL